MVVFNKEMFLNGWGYIAAVVLVALATWLKYIAQPTIIPAQSSILYELAIIPLVVFWAWGRRRTFLLGVTVKNGCFQ